MTQQPRNKPCHFDRRLGYRVTRDDEPCTDRHCLVCGREHVDAARPATCVDCEAKVAADLTDILGAYNDLAIEATAAGNDGRLVAAAPIPGGDAAVLIGPTVRLDLLRTSRHWRDDHPVSQRTGKPVDPMPPLAILAQWEDIYRRWLKHPTNRAASVAGAVRYLKDQVPYLANHVDRTSPDWVAFTRQIRALRSTLERHLHNEREDEQGINCFECGEQLVRRFRDRRRCRHTTPAREWLATLVSYPGQAIYAHEIQAARAPCTACNQGGIDDPRPGRSWECPTCRREYTPSEYAAAVRRDLVERNDGSGWCSIPVAAAAACDIVGRPISATTVRTWIQRKDHITTCCLWSPGERSGVQLVFWPDVLVRATEVRSRGRRPAAVA